MTLMDLTCSLQPWSEIINFLGVNIVWTVIFTINMVVLCNANHKLQSPRFLNAKKKQLWYISSQGPVIEHVTYPHCKHARAVREGAFVFEELEVHLADVVLQVKGRREVGLAVVPRANQHRLMGSVDPFVPPQSIRFLKHLLTHLACECGYNTF